VDPCDRPGELATNSVTLAFFVVESTSVPTDETLRMEITDVDVRSAKRDWLAARDGFATREIVERAFWFYTRLISTQAQQIADDVRRTRDRREA
jgi:hypothetical protein